MKDKFINIVKILYPDNFIRIAKAEEKEKCLLQTLNECIVYITVTLDSHDICIVTDVHISSIMHLVHFFNESYNPKNW